MSKPTTVICIEDKDFSKEMNLPPMKKKKFHVIGEKVFSWQPDRIFYMLREFGEKSFFASEYFKPADEGATSATR